MKNLTDAVQSSSGKYACGDEFTIADLAILFVTSCIIDGNFDYVDRKYIDNFPVLKELHERIKEHDVFTKSRIPVH